MQILNIPEIYEKLYQQDYYYYNMPSNNSRLGMIINVQKYPSHQLKNILEDLLSNDKYTYNHYELHQLFSLTNIHDHEKNVIVDLIIDVISQKLDIIKGALHDTAENITLSVYIQVWKEYHNFTIKLADIIKNYQPHLFDKCIRINKNTNHPIYKNYMYDIFSIIKYNLFFNKIINDPLYDIISSISNDHLEINHSNIEQLIEYFDIIMSIELFWFDITIELKEKIYNIITNILSDLSVINLFCNYLNNLLKNLKNKCKLHVSEFNIDNIIIPNNAERMTIKKIYKIIKILRFCKQNEKLLFCYTKFLQARIINPSYNNLELELELVKRLYYCIGKKNAQSIIHIIEDIIYSKNNCKLIQNANIKIKSDEYMHLSDISPKILNPIILDQKHWKIYNTTYQMKINYPIEMKCYLEIISKAYQNIYDNEYVIDWQPTLGSACFKAQLGNNQVHITCNTLQAIVLFYMNENPKITINQFSRDTLINKKLSKKIFESLIDSDVLMRLGRNQNNEFIYTINHNRYSNTLSIDTRMAFIETFDEESESSNQSVSQHIMTNIHNLSKNITSTFDTDESENDKNSSVYETNESNNEAMTKVQFESSSELHQPSIQSESYSDSDNHSDEFFDFVTEAKSKQSDNKKSNCLKKTQDNNVKSGQQPRINDNISNNTRNKIINMNSESDDDSSGDSSDFDTAPRSKNALQTLYSQKLKKNKKKSIKVKNNNSNSDNCVELIPSTSDSTNGNSNPDSNSGLYSDRFVTHKSKKIGFKKANHSTKNNINKKRTTIEYQKFIAAKSKKIKEEIPRLSFEKYQKLITEKGIQLDNNIL